MAYTIDRTFATDDFDAIAGRTRAALAAEGFAVLTEIDVTATLKARLGADFPDYLILGACNPRMAREALQIEPRIGVLLPCNVVVRRAAPQKVEVSAVQPVALMSPAGNEKLNSLADTVRGLLERAVARI